MIFYFLLKMYFYWNKNLKNELSKALLYWKYLLWVCGLILYLWAEPEIKSASNLFGCHIKMIRLGTPLPQIFSSYRAPIGSVAYRPVAIDGFLQMYSYRIGLHSWITSVGDVYIGFQSGHPSLSPPIHKISTKIVSWNQWIIACPTTTTLRPITIWTNYFSLV